jgi:hypothetical protein
MISNNAFVGLPRLTHTHTIDCQQVFIDKDLLVILQIIDDDDFEPTAAKDFFQNHLMKFEPHLLTDLGMK